MKTATRVRFAAMVATIVAVAAMAAGPTTAAAAPAPYPAFPSTVILVVQNVDATTHVKRLNQDVVVPRGKFFGLVDLASGNLLGVLSLPPAHVQMKALGLLPLVDVTTTIEPTQFIVGHIDFATLQSTTTSVFNIHITKLTAGGTSTNLVGDSCRTAQPITLTMAGKVDLVNGSTFSSSFTIPPLANCGPLTSALNQVFPGPGNTFRASFSPAT